MALPQGLASFPGISVIRSADFTLAHGIDPSVCRITTVPHTDFIAQVGTLQFTFGTDAQAFPDCAVDRASLRIGRGGQLWTLSIRDRRWKWEYTEISGVYNFREPDGSIDEDTKKTPQELAALCLQAMGESGFNVAALPNQGNPERIWRAANPAQELQALCDERGCRVVYRLDNTVRIERTGVGASLPQNGSERNVGFAFSRAAKPDEIKAVGADVRFQTRLKLRAIAKDTDGEVKPIDDLSYKPTDGWAGEFQWFSNVAEAQRPLAFEMVGKWYQVHEQASGGIQVPGFESFALSDINQILPITGSLIDSITAGNKKKPLPAIVTGIFWQKNTDAQNTEEPGEIYNGGFSIDGEAGIVKFSEQVTKIDDNNKNAEAELYLECSYSVQGKKDSPNVFFEKSKPTPGASLGTGPLILNHPEIERKVIQRYTGLTNTLGDREDNLDDANTEADYYIDAEMVKFGLEDAQDVEYAGMHKIELDGAIQQWSIRMGPNGCFTRASRNHEYDPFTPKYEKKKEQQELESLKKVALSAGRGLAAAGRAFLKSFTR